ncbi:hypothetical protein I4U23_009891 [Adineta vaga]|nr:hypothetical protein I4U23_009891 [Adineta vaga]
MNIQLTIMSENVNDDGHHHNNEELTMSYSISIETLTTSNQPLTCCITMDRPRTVNQLNKIKSFTHLDKTDNCRIKSRENIRRSSIHLPVTYSSTIYIPRRSMILPSQSSHHPRSSIIMKHDNLPQNTSNNSNQPTTMSSNTQTSPHLLSASKKSNKNIHSSLPISTSNRLRKRPCHYSSLLLLYVQHIELLFGTGCIIYLQDLYLIIKKVNLNTLKFTDTIHLVNEVFS